LVVLAGVDDEGVLVDVEDVRQRAELRVEADALELGEKGLGDRVLATNPPLGYFGVELAEGGHAKDAPALHHGQLVVALLAHDLDGVTTGYSRGHLQSKEEKTKETTNTHTYTYTHTQQKKIKEKNIDSKKILKRERIS